MADPTLRPSMSGVAARVRDIAQSREIQLSLRISNFFGIILKEVKGDSSKYLYILCDNVMISIYIYIHFFKSCY